MVDFAIAHPVHPKGKSMSQAMIDRRALLQFAAAGFSCQLLMAS
jgi:hypothetical protein